MIEVVAPGALNTVQDLGRFGHGARGVPPSGAFDADALRVGNALVGNDAAAAGLECTLAGPTLRATVDLVVAITGCDAEVTLDDARAPAHEAFVVRSGQTLHVGRTERARAIIAVRGGIAVEPVLGSRSTHVAAGLGPPVVRAGMTLPIGVARDHPLMRSTLRDEARDEVHVVGIAPEGAYTVTQQSDRTGVRLDGPPLKGGEVDPQANPLGAIQVPPDGMPIVLGPDRPITGGYRTVACVIEHDLHVIARAKPGDTLRFVPVSIEQARTLSAQRRRALAEALEAVG